MMMRRLSTIDATVTMEAAAGSGQGTDGRSAAGPAPASAADTAEAPMDADSSGNLGSLGGSAALSRRKLESQRVVSQKLDQSFRKLQVEISEHESKLRRAHCAQQARLTWLISSHRRGSLAVVMRTVCAQGSASNLQLRLPEASTGTCRNPIINRTSIDCRRQSDQNYSLARPRLQPSVSCCGCLTHPQRSSDDKSSKDGHIYVHV